MARIAIDARLWGIKHTGPGRYTENVAKGLIVIDKKDSFTLLVRKGDKDEIKRQKLRASLVQTEAQHYSVKEQLLLPLKLFKIKPDLLHVPHFNIPIFWPGKFVVTIHDLITHDFKGREETTLPQILYWIKYVVHLVVIMMAVKRARAIIVPTNWVKAQVEKKFQVPGRMIFPTLEGVDKVFFESQDKKPNEGVVKKYSLPEKYFVYTGNAYMHKNLDRLIEAIKKAKVTLVMIGARSIFRDRLEQKVNHLGASKHIHFLGRVSDQELREIYRSSTAFITASLSEGFGLPGLEAMAAGTIVLSSNATCLPEVYGDVPMYFNPLNTDEISQRILEVTRLSQVARQQIIEKGQERAKTFTWQKTATLTLRAYDYALGR